MTMKWSSLPLQPCCSLDSELWETRPLPTCYCVKPKQVCVACGTAGQGHDECIVLAEDPGHLEEDWMAL